LKPFLRKTGPFAFQDWAKVFGYNLDAGMWIRQQNHDRAFQIQV
jgi:hypothetical protein